MLDFWRSTFTWKSRPWVDDPHYRWAGGFVGSPGQVYHVRFNLESMFVVRHPESGYSWECFLGAPCRSEYTIAKRNLFQVPSGEWRMAFSRDAAVSISGRSRFSDPSPVNGHLKDMFQDYRVDIRSFDGALPLTGVRAIVSASLENRALGAATTYVDEASGLEVTVEFPVNLINLNEADDEFQICTGPVAVPDLGTWDGEQAHRVFIADVAVSQFDHVEFILRHDVAVAPEERVWMDEPIGRDRLELRDPENPPPGYPPNRPMVKAYHDVIDLPSRNEFWMVDEG